MITFNGDLRLIISDVDQTIADLYRDAAPEMATALTQLLGEGRVLVLISGQGFEGIFRRVVRHLPAGLRYRVFVGHCSGAEVLGFDRDGAPRDQPLYSLYQDISIPKREAWRQVMSVILHEFELRTFPTMDIPRFRALTNGDSRAIMLDDRGPQITFEMPNSHELSLEQARGIGITLADAHNWVFDLREPLMARAQELLDANDIPVSARMAGEFAIDFAIAGVSKMTAVRRILEHDDLYEALGCVSDDLDLVRHVEIWGDKFSMTRGGTDRHMSEALPMAARTIDFRDEDPAELHVGFNIVLWDGHYRLEQGLLEFLQSRPARQY